MKSLKMALASTCAVVAMGAGFDASAAGEPSAYQLNVLFTGESWDNTAGGLKRGWSFMDNADAKLMVDTGKAFGWKGGSVVLEGFYANATSTGNSYVGALDQQSPIDTAMNKPTVKLYQAFYDQNFGSTDVLVGKFDVETEFSVTKPMELFLSKDLTWNTAFDQSGTMPQNGTTGPGNYPYTPLAVRVRQTLSKDFSVAVVVADAVSDDPKNLSNNGVYFGPHYGESVVGEFDYTPDRYTKAMVGVWGLDSKLMAYGQTTPTGAQKYVYGQEGGYFGGTARLYSGEGRRGLDGFFTFGYSSPTSTNVQESLNGGLTYTGLLDARPQDKVGVSFNLNVAPNGYRTYQAQLGTPIGRTETSYEVTYRAKLNDWVTLQPDVQYIVNPNYSRTLKNDLLIGLHFEIGHFFDL